VEAARFLALYSEDGYVNNPVRALPLEPEALTEVAQLQVTETVERKQRQARIDARTATAQDIERELAYLDSRGRYLRRQLARLRRPV
jgi:hypothetical protein